MKRRAHDHSQERHVRDEGTDGLALFTPEQPSVQRGVTASTTLEAGETLSREARSAQQRVILDTLRADGPLTYKELAARTGIELNVICWRMGDFRDMEPCPVQIVRDEMGAVQKRDGGRLMELRPKPYRRAG